MKSFKIRVLLVAVLACSASSMLNAQGKRGKKGPGPDGGPVAVTGIYTNVSGTIAQFNYNREADIEGFLLSDHTLVHLPPRAAVLAQSSVRTGDSVQIAGYAQTSPAGMRLIEALNVQDRTTGRSIVAPQPGAAAPYSGTGRIRQLNYGPDGAVNGFLLNNGTLAMIPPYSASNPSSIQVGAAVSYSGYARRTASDGIVVDIQNLTVNGQQFAFGPATAAAPSPPAAQSFLPTGRTAEPPPPPPPPR